jgi:hypothetical protein
MNGTGIGPPVWKPAWETGDALTTAMHSRRAR